MKTIHSGLVLITACIFLLTSCSSEETISTAGSPVTAPASSGLSIQTLSTKPWLISGGDVLVEVSQDSQANTAPLSVSLNGEDISNAFRSVSAQRLQALLTDLPLGESELRASVSGSNESATLTLTNYPQSGPLLSGPHESPFYCQSSEFLLVNGETLGAATDGQCSVATRVDYVYWSNSEQAFKPLTEQQQQSLTITAAQETSADPIDGQDTDPSVAVLSDIAEIVDYRGATIPFIVRVETGTVNRAIYEIAMLHDPNTGNVDPFNPSDNWNRKLVYTHGGGCRGGWYQQGNRTGGVMRQGLFEQGYAVVSSTLNVFGQNCNDLLASETHIMVKERFIEHYGAPIYTIATGASGGSYQSHQTADNYPGVFDGIIVAASFPDVTTATIFTLADARLLNYYFTETNAETFTVEQQRAVSGFGSWASISNLARGAARLDPNYQFDTTLEEQGGEVSIAALESQRYEPTNRFGVRATVYDHTVNVYGNVDGTFTAQRPLDNAGVQYGLAALNDGAISVRQFIDLNRDIGGFDRDMNHVPERHRADTQARKRAIESGRILYGGAGLASTPIIDYRSYRDHAENGDIHMIVHQFSTRQRLLDANGHAGNHVMQVGGLWGFTQDQPDLGELFRQMDVWLMAILTDNAATDLATKVVDNKPSGLRDACWNIEGDAREKLEHTQTFRGDSPCNELYPAYPTPRQVAGAPLANNIVSCQLRPLMQADYSARFTSIEYAELSRVFPEGVCDWSRSDSSGARHQGTWVSFGPSPVNKLY